MIFNYYKQTPEEMENDRLAEERESPAESLREDQKLSETPGETLEKVCEQPPEKTKDPEDTPFEQFNPKTSGFEEVPDEMLTTKTYDQPEMVKEWEEQYHADMPENPITPEMSAQLAETMEQMWNEMPQDPEEPDSEDPDTNGQPIGNPTGNP